LRYSVIVFAIVGLLSLQLETTPIRPLNTACIDVCLLGHAFERLEDAVTLKSCESSGIVLPSVLLLLIMSAAEEREHVFGNARGGLLVASEEVGDALAIVSGDFGEADICFRVKRVGFAAGSKRGRRGGGCRRD
jgi:hypothetical protein